MTRPAYSSRDHAKSEREYATIKVKLAQRTEAAVLVMPTDKPAQWVPLAALNSTGRIAVHKAALNAEIEIGVDLKLAFRKGLI